MSDAYTKALEKLEQAPRTWLITGVAGFIGSNLLEVLLKRGQKVRGLDNFFTGHARNLEMVKAGVEKERPGAWKNFTFFQGDIRDLKDCREAAKDAQVVLHQAALGSVPRSIEDPITTNACNIDGFLNMLVAARDQGVQNFVYAASSSTYGDEPTLPKREDRIGAPLSPYAVTKYVNELYASVFASTYGLNTIGLRYFNIFGKRQDPNGAYAAVIPQWFAALMRGTPAYINGDGETSRDFCFIDNCIQANILAGTTISPDALNQVYNIAVGEHASLNQLFSYIKTEVAARNPQAAHATPEYRDFRPGDVRHSLADITKARALLNYSPTHTLRQGLKECASWYAENL